jgi:hypothetical protein
MKSVVGWPCGRDAQKILQKIACSCYNPLRPTYMCTMFVVFNPTMTPMYNVGGLDPLLHGFTLLVTSELQSVTY